MNERDYLAERFEEHRTHLRAVAYRMLGSSSDVDDAVQEAWLRLSRAGWRGHRHAAVARDHIDATETYRLGEADPAFGELLPDKQDWLEQDEYEERTNQGLRAIKSLRIPWLVPVSLRRAPRA